MPTSDGPTEDEDDGDESSGGSSGSSGGNPSGDASSEGGSTSGADDPSTGGAGETAVEGSSSGAMMPGNGQPAMGMYADCFEPDLANCTADASVCLMVETFMTGFCTHDECTGPGDCDPAPLDATAAPICVTGADPMGGDTALCALDCSDGKTCPAGMTCVPNVSFGEGYPQYDFCA